MTAQDTTTWKPLLLFPDRPADQKELVRLKTLPDTIVLEHYRDHFRELVAIQNPQRYFQPDFEDFFSKLWTSVSEEARAYEGAWVWYPWKRTLIHTLCEADFVRVRTSRNNYLITTLEGERFREAKIGIAGLSVGYSVALSIVLEGGGKHLRIADRDTLDLSNLNRIPGSLDDTGLSKIALAARRLYELDPYLEVEIYPEGLTRENTSLFVSGLDVLIDEVDSFAIKQLLREEARRLKIPLLMATDNEESGSIDVERYDSDPKTVPYGGRIPELSVDELQKMTKQEVGKLIAQFVGEAHTTDRMRQSLKEIGKTLVSWPQLGGTALLNGGAMAYAIRAILRGDDLQSGRYVASLPQVFSKREVL